MQNMANKQIIGKFYDWWNSIRNYAVKHLIKVIPYLPWMVISTSCIFSYYVSDYHLLVSSRYIYAPILCGVIGIYVHLERKNLVSNRIPKFRALWLLAILIGFYAILLGSRIEELKPIYSASGPLELEIKPTKLKEYKLSGKYYGWVKLVTKRRGHLLLAVGEKTDFGNNGLISSLFFDLNLGAGLPFHSSQCFDSLPYNNINKYDSFSVLLPMLRDIQIIGGKLTININTDKILRFDVPGQKINYEERRMHLIIPIKKLNL